MVGLLLTVLLASVVTWFLLKPFLQSESEQTIYPHEDMESLKQQKLRCLELIRDLDSDYSANKVTESDYSETRQRLSEELAVLMKRLDARKAANG